MEPESRRRELLRALTGLAATAGAGGLAGCLDGAGGDDPGTRTTGGDGETDAGGTTAGEAATTDRPTTTEETTTEDTSTEETTTGDGTGRYTEWVPSPSALGVDGSVAFLFGYVDVASIRQQRDRFGEGAYARFERSLSGFGPLPAIDEIASMVSLFYGAGSGLILVARGSFGGESVANAVLDAEGGEEAGEYGGYDLYAGRSVAAAVADGTAVVRQGSPSDDLAELKTVVDARRGEAERFVAANDDAATLVEELGTGTSALGSLPGENLSEPYDREALSILGLSTNVNGDRTRLEEVHVYESAGAVDVDRSQRAATSGQGVLTGAESASGSRSGRVVVVGATVPTVDLSLGLFGPELDDDDGGGEDTTPAVSFDFEYDADAGQVTITHQGGDNITEENTGGLRYGRPDGSLRRWSLPVSAGDSVTLAPEGGFESGDEVIVVWESPGGDRTALLGRYVVP